MSERFSRPPGTFSGVSGLPNRSKFQNESSARNAIASGLVDGDLNFIIDALNSLDDDITGVSAGSIPGASDIGNAGKFLTTDGAGVLSWIFITAANIAAGAITLAKMAGAAAGSVIGYDGTGAAVAIAPGASGTVLTSNGTAAAPSFQAIPVAISVPTGGMLPFGALAAPSGFLLCDGAAVSRTGYAALFAVIGTNYGAGDGTTTFNVPDKRGRGSIGLDNMGGTSADRVTGSWADTLGGTGGAETHTLGSGEVPALSATVKYGSGGMGQNSLFLNANWGGSTDTTTITTGGGGGAHNNMQPSQADTWIIKT